MEIKRLIENAFEALKYSYSPYSNFKVGAALLTAEGNIYTGCNIENASFSPTNCAERTAVFKAVSSGERDFEAICIVNENQQGEHEFCPPCGVCRQVMAEFCDPKTFTVILAKNVEEYEIYLLADLLPLGFGDKNL